MRPVDEIALVYRFVRGERVPQLAALFQLSESYTYLLIHNGTWLLAIFWGSLWVLFACSMSCHGIVNTAYAKRYWFLHNLLAYGR